MVRLADGTDWVNSSSQSAGMSINIGRAPTYYRPAQPSPEDYKKHMSCAIENYCSTIIKRTLHSKL